MIVMLEGGCERLPNAAFVAAMEDVLETYQKPRDPERPLVCLDETSKQLIMETRKPIPAKPGQPARYDYEYERNGVANIFMMFAPLEGWRKVKVTGHHAALDYAQVLKELSDVHFPDAKRIVLVQDNLNTHTRSNSKSRHFAVAHGLSGFFTSSGGIVDVVMDLRMTSQEGKTT